MNTVDGIKIDEDETSYHNFIIGRQKWFFVLQPVLVDRPCINSYIKTDEIGGVHCSQWEKDDVNDDIDANNGK